MTEIDGEEHAAWNHIARVRIDLHHADRRAAERRVIQPDTIDEIDHARGAQQCIATARHRRRTRMRLLPRQRDLVPALTLRIGHHDNGFMHGFENRNLYDVQLEHGVQGQSAAMLIARITYSYTL